ncbi:hypothetical protein ACS0PU_001943 [Formica fusca]
MKSRNNILCGALVCYNEITSTSVKFRAISAARDVYKHVLSNTSLRENMSPIDLRAWIDTLTLFGSSLARMERMPSAISRFHCTTYKSEIWKQEKCYVSRDRSRN